MAWPLPDKIQRGKPLTAVLTSEIIETVFNILNHLSVRTGRVTKPTIMKTGKPSAMAPWEIVLPETEWQKIRSCWELEIDMDAWTATCYNCAIERATYLSEKTATNQPVLSAQLIGKGNDTLTNHLYVKLDMLNNWLSLDVTTYPRMFDPNSEFAYTLIYKIKSDGSYIDYRTMPRMAVY